MIVYIGDGSCVLHKIAPGCLFRHPIGWRDIAVFWAWQSIRHAFSYQFIKNKAGFSKPTVCDKNVPPFQVVMNYLLMFPWFVWYRYFHSCSCSTLSKCSRLLVPLRHHVHSHYSLELQARQVPRCSWRNDSWNCCILLFLGLPFSCLEPPLIWTLVSLNSLLPGLIFSSRPRSSDSHPGTCSPLLIPPHRLYTFHPSSFPSLFLLCNSQMSSFSDLTVHSIQLFIFYLSTRKFKLLKGYIQTGCSYCMGWIDISTARRGVPTFFT